MGGDQQHSYSLKVFRVSKAKNAFLMGPQVLASYRIFLCTVQVKLLLRYISKY